MIHSKIAIIITAAGSSTRIGSGVKKEYLPYKNGTVLSVCAETFLNAFAEDPEIEITDFIITCPRGGIEECRQALGNVMNSGVHLVEGSDTRQKSVYNGLLAVKGQPDIVLIHDCARPFVSKRIILDNIKQCEKYNAVITAIQSTDSVFISTDNHKVGKYLERKELYNCQTPQTFKFRLIYLAHQTAKSNGIKDATDDAMLVMRIGGIVRIVEGEASNKKVTFKEDF